MRKGGRYLRAKPGAKAERVEWTRTPAEAAAERRAAAREAAAGKSAGAGKAEGDEA